MINFRIFRDISSPSLFAVHRVDSEGNRVQLMKDNLSFEDAQDLLERFKDWKDFDVMQEETQNIQ